ncbi:MAG: alpha/beta fold hydrolase, partial [Planctomycetota bacterium]|nr:alpha/beta fold hydrolase [Planctomycetota bacterium]
KTSEERANVLQLFRADSIIKDAESIRKKMLGPDTKWSILGQSFGGFCAVHYLSAAPEGLNEAFITGGLPSLTRPIDEVYRATHEIVREKNRLYYERYPEDRERVEKILHHLSENEVMIPRGDRLTPRRK